jgi:starvation-inducible outer membrane lipoprotein
MNFKNIALAAITVSILSACAAAPKNTEQTKLAKNKNMVCEHSANTGSHLKKKKCMSKKLADEVRRESQESFKRQTSAGSN